MQDGGALMGLQRETNTKHKRQIDKGKGEDRKVNQRQEEECVALADECVCGSLSASLQFSQTADKR